MENHFSLKLLHSKATLDLLKISKVYDIYCHSGVRGSSKERCRFEQQVSRCNKLILLHRKMRISLLKQKKIMKHIWMLGNQYASFHVFTFQGNKTDISQKPKYVYPNLSFIWYAIEAHSTTLSTSTKNHKHNRSKHLWQQTMVTGTLMGGNQNSYYYLVTELVRFLGHTICKRNFQGTHND